MKVLRNVSAIGCLSVVIALLAAPAAEAETPKIRSYSSSSNENSLENRTSQVFKFDIGLLTETRIYSNYSLLVWRSEESIDEGNVRSFSVNGPYGNLFSVVNSGEYWGYYSDLQKLNIFVLNDSISSLDFEKNAKSDFLFKTLMVQDGRMRAYDCSFNIYPFEKEGYVTINGSRYRWDIGVSNEKLLKEVPIFLAKNGVDLVRDRCSRNSIYLREAAMRYNEDEDVRPDK